LIWSEKIPKKGKKTIGKPIKKISSSTNAHSVFFFRFFNAAAKQSPVWDNLSTSPPPLAAHHYPPPPIRRRRRCAWPIPFLSSLPLSKRFVSASVLCMSLFFFHTSFFVCFFSVVFPPLDFGFSSFHFFLCKKTAASSWVLKKKESLIFFLFFFLACFVNEFQTQRLCSRAGSAETQRCVQLAQRNSVLWRASLCNCQDSVKEVQQQVRVRWKWGKAASLQHPL
jgi:hypothetical protein